MGHEAEEGALLRRHDPDRLVVGVDTQPVEPPRAAAGNGDDLQRLAGAAEYEEPIPIRDVHKRALARSGRPGGGSIGGGSTNGVGTGVWSADGYPDGLTEARAADACAAQLPYEARTSTAKGAREDKDRVPAAVPHVDLWAVGGDAEGMAGELAVAKSDGEAVGSQRSGRLPLSPPYSLDEYVDSE
jgi:hypothetical protein